MKKNSAIVLSIIGALAVIAAINPTMQVYAQDGNTVDATQSNSFTADISQSQTTDDGESLQGFCLQVNQQNAAAGDDASNTATNEIEECQELD
jgi:hypothetical protein